MANEKVLKGPYWTRNWIEAMWRFTNENFVDFDTGAVDYEALGKEEFQFRKALFFRNFKNSERAKMAFASAEDDYKNPVENGKKGGRPKKSPQDAPNGNAGVDMHDAGNGAASKSPTSCDQFTADGDIREDSQAKPDGSAITRNETRAIDALGPSANHYGDTREHSRGRYAPPSCSPEDGNPSSHPSPVRNLPRNKEEVRLFAIDNGLDVDDANDWAEMNLRERHGRDKDGMPIRNWKGAILNYCKAMAAKRETA